ncbi:MAG TPA: C1 family peptidase [Clostridia bacterium]|nr:C1 family peptidase [Clostridia bacterium]
MVTKRIFGWKPDKPDFRDIKYKVVRAVKLPASVDLRDLLSPIEDQGNIGSCTAHAGVAALEYLENKNKVKFTDLSRLFVYYNTRVIEKTVSYDSGAEIRNTIKAMAKQGVCNEGMCPYIEKNYKKKPPASCYTDGIKRKILTYSRLTTLTDMKSCLASGFPFQFGFSVYSSFCSDKVAETGIVNLPTKRESLEGGHAVLAVGYDDSTQRFLVRNSWSAEWGMKGYFTIPYKYLTNSNLADDFWKIEIMQEG